MKNQCKNCGAKTNPAAKFCNQCGKPMQTKQPAAQPSSPASRHTSGKKNAIGAIILISAVGLLALVAAILAIKGIVSGLTPRNDSAQIEAISGQPYGNRAIHIHGDGFGIYDMDNSRVTIDGKEAGILEWEDDEIFVVVPPGVSDGRKEIRVENPPLFKKTVIEQEFLEHNKTELGRVVISPERETILEGDGFRFIAPAGSVARGTEIIISRYDEPSVDESPYWTISGEYSITDRKGNHVFFENQVFFGVEISDAEEAANTSFQIFDELTGLWIAADTWFDENEGRVYIATTHFSDIRTYFNTLRKGVGQIADDATGYVSKKITYVTNELGAAKDWTVELVQDGWINTKDAVYEPYDSVTDINNRFIVYWRIADYQKDPSIQDKACLMVTAFNHAYEEYARLFGYEQMPSVTKTKIFSGIFSDPVQVPDPIKVYIDPLYNQKGAVAKTGTSGNIMMPSEYPANDLASTAAHELFHVVQYKLLGFKMSYMGTTNYKDLLDNSFTGNNAEVYRWFANNVWFFDATAEYAARFIGTNVGVDAPIHPRIEANRIYYANNGTHEYGVSSFLDYILTHKNNPGFEDALRGRAFTEMWKAVTGNYSITSSINIPFEKYVHEQLNENVTSAYLDFWRDAYTVGSMPEAVFIANGKEDIINLRENFTKNQMQVMGNAVGVFRYLLAPSANKSGLDNETALNRSIWFEVSPADMRGDVYVLSGLEMADRLPDRPRAYSINMPGSSPADALLPYKTGHTQALIVVLSNTETSDETAKITMKQTDVLWDNQQEIEKMVGNSTLRRKDKLQFTPTLPKLNAGEEPFKARILLNDNYDYLTEIENVQNGKPFQVTAPMHDIPPSQVSVNIKIYQGEKLVHEYKSVEKGFAVKVEIEGADPVRYSLAAGQDQVEHSFKATATPYANYNYVWVFGDGTPAGKTEGRYGSEISHTFSGPGQYAASVTVYDQKGKIVANDSVRIILEQQQDATASPDYDAAGQDTNSSEPKYAWVLVDTLLHEAKEEIAYINNDNQENYSYEASASPGKLYARITYVGESDDERFVEGRKKGDWALFESVSSTPPTVIYSRDQVRLPASFTLTGNNLEAQYVIGWVSADICAWGDSLYECSSDLIVYNRMETEGRQLKDRLQLSSVDINLSLEDVFTQTIYEGNEPGDTMAIRTTMGQGDYFLFGVSYRYRWLEIGSAGVPTNVEPEPTEASWHLVDTVVYDGKKDIEDKNREYAGVYENSGTASPGAFTHTWAYVGETDNYYDPPIVHGEGSSCEGTFTQPPGAFKGGEELSLTYSLTFTDVNHSYFQSECMLSSRIYLLEDGQPDPSRSPIYFEDGNGKSIVAINTAANNTVLSNKKTVEAIPPQGTDMGDQISIRVYFTQGNLPRYVEYIYEWK